MTTGPFSPIAGALDLGGPGGGHFNADAVYFEYSKAADPIASGAISPVPAARFGREHYATGESRVVPIDLAAHLGTPGPATSPSLCANFVRVCAGDDLPTPVNASSQLYHVLWGRGTTTLRDGALHWEKGDFFTLPAGADAVHRASEDSAMYWVHDEPLLRYLGATAVEARFRPTHYRRADAERALDQVAADPEAANRSRVSVLLANRALDQTLTVTHVLWAMFGLLPAGGAQPPHRHQSVAVDLVLDCRPGCYTLLGDLDDSGERLVNIERVDWEPGAAFVTPPGRWHSHHNESGAPAHIIPIQDAGLHTYLRTLDIRFMSKEQAARALGALTAGPALVPAGVA
ncbi:MAG TPA: cupin domain-containing protein [Acidimicrobiales bacterium]|nr:cupin domain-containing protein [Acidimicrobiales bacterium]